MIKKLQSQWISLFSLILATFIAVREYHQPGREYNQQFCNPSEELFLLDPLKGAQDSLSQSFAFSLQNDNVPPDKQTVYVESVKSLPVGHSETTTVVKSGDTLQSLLKKLNLSVKQIGEVVKSLQKVCTLKDIKPGQKIQIKTEKQDGITYLTQLEFRPNLESIVSLKKTYQGFIAQKNPIKLKKVLKRAMGIVKSSFYSSVAKSGVPQNIVKEVINTLSYTVNFQHSIKVGDPFEVLYETFVNTEGKTIKTGKLLYAAFAAGGQVHTIYHHASAQGQSAYYNIKGESLRRHLLQTPIEATKMRITSKFGFRLHPLKGFTKAHKGVDLGAKSGTAVMAAGEGIIMKAGYNGNYGNYVLIKHPGNYQTAYAHLQKIASGIRPGVSVKQRQILGTVGRTGRTTGDHLHFEVLKNGVHINPLSVKMLPTTKLTGKEAQRFQQTKRNIHMHVAGIVPQNRYAQAPMKNLG